MERPYNQAHLPALPCYPLPVTMPSLYAETEINAPAAAVWDALVRKENWRYWNTFLYDCDPRSSFMLGREVFIAMQRIEGDADTEFQPVVTTLRPGSCLRWVSKIPGLKTEHSFEMQEITPGRTRYLHRDIFMGPLSRMFLPFIRDDEREGLRRMAHQLKRYVESGGQPQRDPYGRNAYGDPYGGRGGGYDDRGYGGGYSERGYDEPRYGRGEPNYPERGYPPERGYDDRRYDDRSYDDRKYDDRGYRDRTEPRYDDRGYDDRGYRTPPDRTPPDRGYPDRGDPDYRDDGW
ncbi:MAG: SRPBCC domain-containing protein [Cyanobacteria bacterium P01_A01_bin.15]